MAKRLPKYVPSLTRISVVDTPTTADKDQQINQVNDEFRKLSTFGNKLAQDLEDLKKGLDPANKPKPDDNGGGDNTGGGGGDITGGDTNININVRGNWALTLLHKAERLFRQKWTQAINFIDGFQVPPDRPSIKLPIWWEFENEDIASDLKSDPNSSLPTQTKVKANAMLDLGGILSLITTRYSVRKRTDTNANNFVNTQAWRKEVIELVNDRATVDEYMFYGSTNELNYTALGVPFVDRGWYDLRAVIEEFSWSIIGTEHNTVRFNNLGELVETNIVRVIPGGVNQVEVDADLEINNGKRLIINDPSNLYPTSFYTHLTPTAPVNYYLPIDAGLTGQVLESDGTGNLAWVYRLSSLPAGTIHQTLRHNGTTWEATDSLKVAPGYIDVNVPMQVNNGNVIQFWNVGSTNFVALRSHNSLATDTIYTLPLDDGTVGQVLSTDGIGNMSWQTVAGGATNQIKLYKLDFNKALPTPQTHPITLPINSEILRITVRVDATLSGGVGQIKINGSTSIILADEGIHYLSTQGKYDTEYTGDATIALAGMVGNLEYVQFGGGLGSGRIFIEVGVPI